MQNNALDQGRITGTIDEATYRRAVALFQEDNFGMIWAAASVSVRSEYIARALNYTFDPGPVVHEVNVAPTGTFRDPLADRLDVIEKLLYTVLDAVKAKNRTKA